MMLSLHCGGYNSKDRFTKWTFNRQNPLEKCVLNTQVQSSELHPTMKDIKVIKHLIRILSNKGDTICDPFMGSGTTGIAAKELERNFIGFEIDKDYYKICQDRINQSTQMSIDWKLP